MPITPNKLYNILISHFGHQDWWPVDKAYHKKNKSDLRFEIMVGAILTQNTAWTNVERALENLKKNDSLSVGKIIRADEKSLKTMIQPSGFFNQKSQRLKVFAIYLHEKYEDDLDKFFSRDLQELRQELLSLNGIGHETADSILLYAGDFPIFVVDAYTRRICKRISINVERDSYDYIQKYFEEKLSINDSEKDTVFLYKQIHALIVELAKNYCKKKPDCNNCPLFACCEFNL